MNAMNVSGQRKGAMFRRHACMYVAIADYALFFPHDSYWSFCTFSSGPWWTPHLKSYLSPGKGSLLCNTASSGFCWERIFHPTQRICSLLFIPHRSFQVDVVCLATVRRGRSSAVGIATGYGLDDQGVRVPVPVGSNILSSPCRPPNLLSSGYRELFPRE
jgi:hypothetical protein